MTFPQIRRRRACKPGCYEISMLHPQFFLPHLAVLYALCLTCAGSQSGKPSSGGQGTQEVENANHIPLEIPLAAKVGGGSVAGEAQSPKAASPDRQKLDRQRRLIFLRQEMAEKEGRVKQYHVLAKRLRKGLHVSRDALQEDIQKVLGHIDHILLGIENVKGRLERKKERLLRRLNYRTYPEEDVPAVRNGSNITGIGGAMDCPIDCDPAFCDVTEGLTEGKGDTQCFKVTRTKDGESGEEKKVHVCSPFKNMALQSCPPDFQRCAMVAPDRDLSVTVDAFVARTGKASNEIEPRKQPLTIRGKNLQQCIKLVMTPLDVECRPDTATQLVESAVDKSPPLAYPNVSADRRSATFPDVEVTIPGSYNLCLVQFSVSPVTQQILILGAASIGHITARLPTATRVSTAQPVESLLVTESPVRYLTSVPL